MNKLKKFMYLTVLLGVMVSTTGCYTTPEGGQIVVIRNGGPFDNKNIRQIVCPGKSRESTGVSSVEHSYYDNSSQRQFRFDDDEKADAGPIENLRTSDGVKATLSGTIYFKTRFDCTKQGQDLLKKFDNANVSRPEGERPWEDWAGWLNATWKPVLDANFRSTVTQFSCRQLISSCALLAQNGTVKQEDLEKSDNESNISKVEAAVAANLQDQLNTKIGPYFTDIQFNLQPVQLPEVDDAIAHAQQAFAKVADVRAEAEKQNQQIDVERNKRKASAERQKGYKSCPSCARQDELSKLPANLQTLVFGGGNAPVAIGGK